MSALLKAYDTETMKEEILYYQRSRRSLWLYVYNLFGDLIYQFPLSVTDSVIPITIPIPERDYYVAKIQDGSVHRYVILKPANAKDRLLFIFRPFEDTVEIKSRTVTAKKKLRYIFQDLAVCDVSDLPSGKYTLKMGDRIFGFEIDQPFFRRRG